MISSVFRQMSPEEMNIEEIADIKMIHIYDLTGAEKPDGKYELFKDKHGMVIGAFSGLKLSYLRLIIRRRISRPSLWMIPLERLWRQVRFRDMNLF